MKLQIFALLEIADDGGSYSHKITGWDALADVARLERTETWTDVPAPLVERRVVVDGLDVTDFAIMTTNRDAVWSTAPRRGENQIIETLPGREWDAGKVHDEMDITLDMVVMGSSPNGTRAFDEHAKRLENIHEVTRRLRPFQLLPVHVYEGSDVKECWAEQVASMPFTEMGLAAARSVVGMKAPAGVWHDRFVRSQTLRWVDTPTTLAFDAFAGSTAPLWDMTVIVHGKVVDPRLGDPSSPNWVQYEAQVDRLETLTVVSCRTSDSDGFAVTKDGVDVIEDVRHEGNGPLLTLYPRRLDGVYVIRCVAGEAPGNDATVTLIGRRKFWVA